MVYVDSRVGSQEIAPILKTMGVPVRLDTLESGDFAWSGHGPDGDIAVGIERKVLTDLLQSRNEGRLGGTQVPLMAATYHDRYLLVEGMIKIDDDGYLLRWDYRTRPPSWQPVTYIRGGKQHYTTFSEIYKYVLTFQRACGMSPIWTNSREHTARVLAAMYWHYQTPWEDHKSHKVLSQAHTVDNESRFSFKPQAPSVARMVASQLPNIGYKKSAEVEKQFPTVADMCMATIKEWQKVPGIGKTIAKRIFAALNEPGHKI